MDNVAEAVGFEPTVGFHPRSVSNRVLSASQPRLRRIPFSEEGAAGQGGKALFEVISVALQDESLGNPDAWPHARQAGCQGPVTP